MIKSGKRRFKYIYAALQIVDDIQLILRQAQTEALRSINKAMLTAYWLVGKRIIEEEQGGKLRATYGKGLLKYLSAELQKEFGKGFSVNNLQNMRLFYVSYPIQQTLSAKLSSKNQHTQAVPVPLVKQQTLSANLPISENGNVETPDFELSWSHYQLIMRIADENERSFYEVEAAKNQWSLRELKRQFDSALYLRLAMSKDKKGIKELAERGQVIVTAKDTIKDPYILEFLNLKDHYRYSENDLEHALIDKLEHFLLELGTGFTFAARQKRITFDEKHFYIDLVFYNRLLRCFVIIDLKIGELQHQDIGQMQMYVNYYDRYIKAADEHKTIGIILCRDKSETLVEITLPEDNDQIFASRYKTILPDKEMLKKLLTSRDDMDE